MLIAESRNKTTGVDRMSGYETLQKVNKILWRILIIGFVIFLIEYFFKIHWILATVSSIVLIIAGLFSILFLVEFVWSFFHNRSG